MSDFWPADFGVGTFTPPIKVLKNQADALTQKTNGAVVASIVTRKFGDKLLQHKLVLEVPALDNYTYELLVVNHQIPLYPLKINGHGKGWVECKDHEEFVRTLKAILTSEETRRTVGALLAQVDADAEQTEEIPS